MRALRNHHDLFNLIDAVMFQKLPCILNVCYFDKPQLVDDKINICMSGARVRKHIQMLAKRFIAIKNP
ncbi:MAG: hypothetical protein LBF22_10320 [Deltaproteobacteria bacterium]|nr:hypothetical protein [Deltaproteobacteria bacterium]